VNDAAAFALIDRRNRIAEYEAQIAALETERDAALHEVERLQHALGAVHDEDPYGYGSVIVQRVWDRTAAADFRGPA
jgi:uncharacterized protein (DUF3084 family)